MNRHLLILKSIIIVTSLTASVYANNWVGYYVGGNLGLSFNYNQLKSHHLGFTNPNEECNKNSNFTTLTPGIQGGYLTQYSSSYLIGLDADLRINTRQKNTLDCRSAFNPNIYDRFIVKNQLQGAIKARAGYPIKWNEYNFLPYLTTGVSVATIDLKYKNEIDDHYSRNTISLSWLVGAGVEWTVNQNWSLRAEYSYINYGNTTKLRISNLYGLIDSNGVGRVALSSNKFIVGFNYWIQ